MKFYHTQEDRSVDLEDPILCTKEDAWLGQAYYFWEDESDAIYWGVRFKSRNGKSYIVYKADIETDNLLDTVFNREHYFFWIRQIEKLGKLFVKKAMVKPSIKEINDYFIEKGTWSKFDGILFQDISQNDVHFIVRGFQYKKRIQLAVFKKEIIRNFAVHLRQYG